MATGERGRDLDHPRVVGRDHRVALPAEQHLEAAHVGLVDLQPLLEGDRLGLEVGALAQPHPGALVGQRPTVALGAVEGGLDDGSGLREVLAQLAQRGQGAVGGGVVLHVEGDRGAGVAGGAADRAGVLERHLVADPGQELADRGELDGDLGAAGQPARGQRREEVDVGRHGRLGLLGVEGVLTEVVQGGGEPVRGQHGGRVDGRLGGLAGHVGVHDPGRHRHGGDDPLDLLAAGQHEQGLAQQWHAAQVTRDPTPAPTPYAVAAWPPPGPAPRPRSPRRRPGPPTRPRCRPRRRATASRPRRTTAGAGR